MNLTSLSLMIIIVSIVIALLIILIKLNNSSTPTTPSTSSPPPPPSPSSSGWQGLAIAAVVLVAIAGGLLWWSPWDGVNDPVAKAEAQRQELLVAGWREATVIVPYSAMADGRKLTVLAVKFPAEVSGRSIVFKEFRFTQLFRLGKNGIYVPLEAEHPPASGYVPGKPEQGGCWGIFQPETAGEIPVRIFWRPR